jgi:hypothetical protein
MALPVLVLISVQTTRAQVGLLGVRVVPRQAYIFSDGTPVVDANGHFAVLDPGPHQIGVYNYGYKPEFRMVTIEAGKVTVIDVTLQPIPGTISGPFGCITIEGAPRDAILLNGKYPSFFVGHGDEFDNEWGWKQELIVPPGKYELTVWRGDPMIWTTTVDVPANQRVVVDANKGVRKTVPWPRGEHLAAMPRFQAGMASAIVAIQKVTGQFSASPQQINCGDSTRLTWSSDGAAQTEISGVGTVNPSGDQTVQPKQTTDYKFTAAGPGGIYTSDSTVNVNTGIQASLNVSPAEVQYRQSGDRVEQGGNATVSWSAGNANTVSLDPFGSVGTSGDRSIPIRPAKTSPGPVDETVTFTLHASNACGGSETRTASLHIGGMIGPAVNESTMEKLLKYNSIYFATNYPLASNPNGGLVTSQERRLDDVIDSFKQYLQIRPEAHLILQGNADVRGSVEYNRALSERRADRVKNYLVAHGIPAGSIETQAFGKEKNLTQEEVRALLEQNPDITPEDRKRISRASVIIWWANNRRVDFRLSTTGQVSLRYFPFNADDRDVLLDHKHIGRKAPAKK